MKPILLLILICAFGATSTKAQNAETIDSTVILISEIENSLLYKTGTISLESDNAVLEVPKGFRYLDPAQSSYVLTNLWGNPVDSTILGMLVPEGRGILQHNSWVFTINYEEEGFVRDNDAASINPEKLLLDQRAEFNLLNPERIKLGYAPIEFISWAVKPHYSSESKVLKWAKELKFGTDSLNTLNYNLRILGRKGFIKMNAIASMPELDEVKSQIAPILASISFNDGHKYTDFDKNKDPISPWTVQSLVAGKVKSSSNASNFITNYWKILALIIIALAGFTWAIKSRKLKKEA